MILDDNFTTMAPAWGKPNAHVSFDRENHRLDIHVTPEAQWWLIRGDLNYLGSKTPQVTISATMGREDVADPGAGSGLIFWAKDGDNLYEYVVANGAFAVFRRVGGRWAGIIGWTKAPVGFGGPPNTLGVIDEGKRAYLWINDGILAVIPAPTPRTYDRVGIVCQSGATAPNVCGFSEFEINAAPGSPLASEMGPMSAVR